MISFRFDGEFETFQIVPTSEGFRVEFSVPATRWCHSLLVHPSWFLTVLRDGSPSTSAFLPLQASSSAFNLKTRASNSLIALHLLFLLSVCLIFRFLRVLTVPNSWLQFFIHAPTSFHRAHYYTEGVLDPFTHIDGHLDESIRTTYIDTNVHKYIHTYIHTYVHTYIPCLQLCLLYIPCLHQPCKSDMRFQCRMNFPYWQ